MIRFVNIETGRTYNGDVAYDDFGNIDSESSYVHWFDGQQSTGLIYVQKICFLTDAAAATIRMGEQDIFRLIDPAKISKETETEVSGNIYNDITQMYADDNTVTSAGFAYNGLYLHMMYVAAECDEAYEARQLFTINDIPFYIGADFQEMREELKIGVHNQGLEIPESVQKAIYPSNVHEESVDNVLMNRKYKELMMDFIDIVGNKGSYQSLINSLNWFEFPRNLTVKEFWKHEEWGRTIYNDQEFTQILKSDMEHMLTNYAKTTFIGVYCACQKIKRTDDGRVIYDEVSDVEAFQAQYYEDESTNENPDGYKYIDDADGLLIVKGYDNFTGPIKPEPVPALENISMQWTKEDMSIKMALLGNFYEEYFMPIHLDLIHSTIEDMVFTNAIKVLSDGCIQRTDEVLDNGRIDCNIEDGQEFMMTDISVEAAEETLFANKYNPDLTIDETKGLHNTLFEQHGEKIYKEKKKNNEKRIRNILNRNQIRAQVYEEKYDSLLQQVTEQYYDQYNLDVRLDPEYSDRPEDEIEEEIQRRLIEQTESLLIIECDKRIDEIVEAELYKLVHKEIDKMVGNILGSNQDKSDVMYNNHLILGVTDELVKIPTDLLMDHDIDLSDEEDTTKDSLQQWLKTFYLNNYNGVGAIIPMEFSIVTDNQIDLIYRETLSVMNDVTNSWETITFNNVFETEKRSDGFYNIKVSFDMLVTRDKEYDFRIQLFCTNGHTYVKSVKFNVVDTRRSLLKLYKIVKNDTISIDQNEEKYHNFNDYMWRRIRRGANEELPTPYFQYVARSLDQDSSIGMSRLVIMRKKFKWNDTEEILSSTNIENLLHITTDTKVRLILTSAKTAMQRIESNYTVIFTKHVNTGQLIPDDKGHNPGDEGYEDTYYIIDYNFWISNGFNLSDYQIDTLNKLLTQIEKLSNLHSTDRMIVRNEDIFIPQLHHFEEVNIGVRTNEDLRTSQSCSLADISIGQNETLCVVPDIRYSRYIDRNACEWIFRNASTGTEYKLPSIKEPFILSSDKRYPKLDPGYYDIIFRYRLSTETDNIHEVTMESAFIQLPDPKLHTRLNAQLDNKYEYELTLMSDILWERADFEKITI